jgi:hypothetical protein
MRHVTDYSGPIAFLHRRQTTRVRPSTPSMGPLPQKRPIVDCLHPFLPWREGGADVQAGRRAVLGHPAELRSNRTHAIGRSLDAGDVAQFSLMSAGEGELESAVAPTWPSLEPALPNVAQLRQRTGERRRAASAQRSSAAAARAGSPLLPNRGQPVGTSRTITLWTAPVDSTSNGHVPPGRRRLTPVQAEPLLPRLLVGTSQGSTRPSSWTNQTATPSRSNGGRIRCTSLRYVGASGKTKPMSA